MHRQIEIASDRLSGWVARFIQRNGLEDWHVDTDEGRVTSIRLHGALPDESGRLAFATIKLPWYGVSPPIFQQLIDVCPSNDSLADSIAAVERFVQARRTVLLLGVRRGGFVIGTATDGKPVSGRHGRRHVQGRTAAGGWSQQRFARRREGQTNVVVKAVVDKASTEIAGQQHDVVLLAGDKVLLGRVLKHPDLSAVQKLPHSPVLTLPDPRGGALADLAKRSLAVQISIDHMAAAKCQN